MKLKLHATPIPSYNHLSQKNSNNNKDNLISTICCSLTSKNTSVQKFSLHLIPTQHVRPFVFFSKSEDLKEPTVLHELSQNHHVSFCRCWIMVYLWSHWYKWTDVNTNVKCILLISWTFRKHTEHIHWIMCI